MLPGVSLKVVQRSDGPAAGYETVMVEIEVAAGVIVPPHTHPGVESTFVLEGDGELHIHGLPPRQLRAGDLFQSPPDTIHFVKIGAKARVCSTLVVRKGEPLTSPASVSAPVTDAASGA